MISITEIVLIVAGFAAIILGYLLPAGKELDEEDKMLMEREIRELVRREVEEQKDTIDDMVGDSVENSLDRTERAMERISNEKMSAIGEYSDTVINDIHKNHDEVMFMYDMLNDKHKNLTSVVSEVTRKADEAKQVVRDAEATAKEAQEASNLLAATDEKSNVRAILLDETDDKLSGIRIPYKEKKEVSLSDIDGYFFQENIETLAKADIVGGFPDGTFRPDELVTRAQAAVFVKNLLDAIE